MTRIASRSNVALPSGARALPGITVQAADGSGGLSAYLAEPANKPTGVVVLIQEIFGVNQAMRDIAAWVAGIGFIAVCPDLFLRSNPASTSPTNQKPNGRRCSNCSTPSIRRKASRI
jgi:dienelactone hydrolase